MKPIEIAKCGMNCSLCISYQKKRCKGCNIETHKRLKCFAKTCNIQVQYCYDCDYFPCKQLLKLDKKYQHRYSMSMIENLSMINEKGMNDFIAEQTNIYTCSTCHNLLSVHQKKCHYCEEKLNNELRLKRKNYHHLIAPCGMNCELCDKYNNYKYNVKKIKGKVCHCKGCNIENKNCSFIKQKCPTKNIYQLEFCYECPLFPCEILQKIKSDNYDNIKNLNYIKEHSLNEFIELQHEKYKCQQCGSLVCIHNNICYNCQKKKEE